MPITSTLFLAYSIKFGQIPASNDPFLIFKFFLSK